MTVTPAPLGEFEQLVLLAVLRLGDDGYGATICRAIEESTGRTLSIGAIYTTLERLHAKRLLTCHIAGPTNERGGRRRKVYTLTPDGRTAISRAYLSWQNMTRGLKGKLIP